MKLLYNFRLLALGLIMVAGATSCSEEVPPTLPGAQEIICEVGDQPTITFTAGGNWTLTSDSQWCKFFTHTGDTDVKMSGAAGTHTVKLKITDEDIRSQPTFAKITIQIGSRKGIIAKIERGADKLYMRLYDITDTPKQAIELGYIDWIPFRLEANFRFEAVEIPDWIEIGYDEGGGKVVVNNTITGVPGEQTEAFARIVNNGDREQYEIKAEEGHVIKFADLKGEHTFEFPIFYKGMGAYKLEFEGPTDQIYGWEVSLDGKEFRQKNNTTGQVIKFDNKLSYEITAQDDSFRVIRIDQNVERGIPSYIFYEESETCWINFEKGKTDFSQLTITIEETETTRHGMVMVVPMKVWNKIRADIGRYILAEDSSSGIVLDTIDNDYQQYIIMEFKQHDLSAECPYIYHSLTTLDIPAIKIEDAQLTEKYGAEEVYSCPFVNPIEGKRPGIIIDPRIEDWTTNNHEGGNATAEVWYNDTLLSIAEDEYYIGDNKDEMLAVHLWGPNAGFRDNVYIVFKVNGKAKKLIVVTPPTK